MKLSINRETEVPIRRAITDPRLGDRFDVEIINVNKINHDAFLRISATENAVKLNLC
jgi:hypothetical protein